MTTHKTIKNTTDELTDIICILDRSGSMGEPELISKTIEGFNTLVADQRKETGRAKMTLCLFDGSVYNKSKSHEIVYNRVDLSEVKDLDKTTYVPNGSTALYDAIGFTISNFYNNWKDSQDKSSKVIIMIMTDGYENASNEYTKDAVAELIKRRTEEDGWVFLFLGANIDTMSVGGGMGVSVGNTMSFSGDGKGFSTGYCKMSSSVSKMRSVSYTASMSNSLLSDDETEGDKK